MAKKKKRTWLKYEPALETCRDCGGRNTSRIDVVEPYDERLLGPKPTAEEVGNGSAFFSRSCVDCDHTIRTELREEGALDLLGQRHAKRSDGKGRGFRRYH